MDSKYRTPDEIFGELFRDVQMARIFEDSKTFSDCIPNTSAEKILHEYEIAKEQTAFSLYEFVFNHFSVPGQRDSDFASDRQEPVESHIEKLWPVLSRMSDREEPGSSLIPLPYPYIVPGGRFREIYYWDSYFTQLGLAASGQVHMIENMVRNFAYLIDLLGHIPNGNRSYFISRSQPPFFAFMVELLANNLGDHIYLEYASSLAKEYRFWMDGEETIHPGQSAQKRVVRLSDGHYLNRYYDDLPFPRQESYREDIHLAGQSSRQQKDLFLNLRAACESGWDFSSRWCEVPGDLTTIQTTHIIPVDLNCCLWKLEELLSKSYSMKAKENESLQIKQKADLRKKLIAQYLFDEQQGYFFDYDFVKRTRTPSIHAAGLFPLFVDIVSQSVATDCVTFVKEHLWCFGGISTTNLRTGQQWDAPNGWAPLQWIAFEGLLQHGFVEEAETLAKRWINLNKLIFHATGKLMEKYNVMDTGVTAGGGEYPVQDGFGWTNGVLLAMTRDKRVSVS